jgi:hypothetical protein
MAVCSMSIALGSDASAFDLDGPLPEIPESNASKSGRERVIERARRDNLTVRQSAQIAGSYGGLALVGTPAMIADQMEEWLYSGACDASTSCSRGSRAASTISSTGSSPNSSAATSSAANTKAKPCAKTSTSPAPKTASSQGGASNPEHR